ncbi:unnamed protein product [Protopolystoma xenopodis]|uniref:Trafficking protein particle complex subunit 11 domain-containing protein n=1 Tax=Protopolystoma xenopodis TaxID=117903 RepID=A0A3S5CMW5_9PLAT|nr:unnamed protein product [Protopolystoma xenopodis]
MNFQICKLSFQNNASDAISQFRRHIDFFKNLVGLPELAFEHEAWIFELLGDLFHEAIRLNLTALLTQHPGLYYQEAARHAIARRRVPHDIPEPSEASSDLTGGVFLDQTSKNVAFMSDKLPSRVAQRTSISSDPSQSPDQISAVVGDQLVNSAQTDTVMSSQITGHPSRRSASIGSAGGIEFYGQRAWRQRNQSIEPPDAAKERAGILSLEKR